MTRVAARMPLPIAMLFVVVGVGHAQDPVDLLTRGYRAYSELDFSAAAGLIRSAITAGAATRVAPAELARALTHLGASEIFRGNGDSARAAFTRLVLGFPRHRVDELVFPPEVTSLFQRVRAATPVVEVVTSVERRIVPGRESWQARLFSSAHHEISAAVARTDGRPVRQLFVGPIGDSLVLRWDGRDSTGSLIPSGSYVLTVRSGVAGDWQRLTQLPLDVQVFLSDTVPLPGPLLDSRFRPEARGRDEGLEALTGGLATSLAVMVLPAAFSSSGEIGAGRFAVAGALSIAGVIGFFTQRPGSPLPMNVAYNDSLRSDWEQRVQTAIQLNATRRRASEIVIRAGASTVVELGGR